MAFDRRHGGFGDAPKFPRPSELLFLLREHARRSAGGSGAQAPLLMAADTLRAMALGGMRDHIGGGFHRYSVDAEWRVPHFEKMLYDQAQLVLAYLEAAQATGDDFFATVAEDTLGYVLRDLTDPRGGFYSAEDADSVPPEQAGQSGRRTNPRARSTSGATPKSATLLGADASGRAPALRDRAGRQRAARSAGGVHGPEPALRGAVDRRRRRAERSGRRRMSLPRSGARATTLFDGSRATSAAAPRRQGPDRLERADDRGVRPRRARRCRTARPARRYLDGRAARCRVHSRTTLWASRRSRLLRRYRDGEAAIDGYAEDYAYLIFGLLELFQADGDPAWLEWAMALQAAAGCAVLGSSRRRRGSARPARDPTVLLRLKEDYDGAEPAASSVSVLNLLTTDTPRRHGQRPDESGADARRASAREIGAAGRVVPDDARRALGVARRSTCRSSSSEPGAPPTRRRC